MRRALVVTLCTLVGLALPSVAQARELRGTVGPAFTISLIDESGNRVTHIEAGTHTIVITDNSIDHNFHLTGPGVDVLTEIEFVGTMTWTLTFVDGIYHFVCDPHVDVMNGRFAVGTAALPPPTPPARWSCATAAGWWSPAGSAPPWSRPAAHPTRSAATWRRWRPVPAPTGCWTPRAGRWR
mgnify:CR=1 FL=1